MSFWKKLLKRDNTASTGSTLATALAGLSGSGSGTSVGNDWQAMAIPAVSRCLQVISEGVANLPMRYMKQTGGVYREFDTHVLHYLLRIQPNPYMSAYTFWSMLVQMMYHGNGNAYVFPKNVGQDDMELILLNPYCVSHDKVSNIYYVNDIEQGVAGTFHEDEILHFFRFSFDGKTGVSVIKYSQRALSIAATGDQETLNRFTTGGNVRGFVTNDKSVRGFGEYQDSELKTTAESLDDLLNGQGAHIASLPGQAGFQQISLSSTDMQFLESRKFALADISRIYGVPRNALNEDSSVNYKSAEMSQVAFLTNTLNPILRRIENEFTRKLIPRSQCCSRIFQFDRRELYSCDLESLSNYQMKTIQSGIYSVNDWRKKENQEPVDGGDRILVSTNLAPLDSAKLTGEQKVQQPQQ